MAAMQAGMAHRSAVYKKQQAILHTWYAVAWLYSKRRGVLKCRVHKNSPDDPGDKIFK